MPLRKTNILIILLLAISIYSCQKIRQLPPEPYIEFRKFSVLDTTDILGNSFKGGILTFYIEDGDGDIGMLQPLPGDTNPDTTNLTFFLYKKSNGMYSEPDDTLGYRVPYIEKEGQNQIIQGFIEIFFSYIGYHDDDTIKYDFYISDRAGNISNTASSCEISFTDGGGCVENIQN